MKHSMFWMRRSVLMIATLLLASLFVFAITPAHAEDVPADTAADEVAEASMEVMEEEPALGAEDEDEEDSAYEVDITRLGGLFLAAGDIVRIDEALDSDVFAAGYKVLTKQAIDGDVFAGGQDIVIDEAVNGSVRVVGATVTIDATIEGNVLVIAETVILTEDAVVKGHLSGIAAYFELDGTVEKKVAIGGGYAELSGTFMDEMTVYVENVTANDGSTFEANVAVEGPNTPVVKDEVTGADYFSYTENDWNKEDKHAVNAGGLLGALIGGTLMIALWKFVSLALVGVLLIALWPTWTQKATAAMSDMKNVWSNLGRGVLFFLLTPIIALLVAFTVIGIPLAVLVMMLYPIVLIVASLIAGMAIGHRVFGNKKETTMGQRIGHFLVGYLILSILAIIPVVGWLVALVAILWGAGALYDMCVKQTRKQKK